MMEYAADGSASDDVPGRGATVVRHTRRLTDKLLVAFHQACDQGDVEVAGELLRVVELMITRRPVTPNTNRRRNLEGLVAAHERLWLLRHPDQAR